MKTKTKKLDMVRIQAMKLFLLPSKRKTSLPPCCPHALASIFCNSFNTSLQISWAGSKFSFIHLADKFLLREQELRRVHSSRCWGILLFISLAGGNCIWMSGPVFKILGMTPEYGDTCLLVLLYHTFNHFLLPIKHVLVLLDHCGVSHRSLPLLSLSHGNATFQLLQIMSLFPLITDCSCKVAHLSTWKCYGQSSRPVLMNFWLSWHGAKAY